MRPRVLFALAALAVAPRPARADVLLHDDGHWRVYTTGRAEAHYQLAQGDGDPHNLNNKLVGGQFQNTGQDQNNQIFDSRIRSGFIGTQLGFGMIDQFTDTLQGKAFVSIWFNGIDSHKSTPPQTKDVDAREAWGALSGRGGEFLFGRAFSIFGSASGAVNAYAYEFAVGNPCLLDVSTIACGSVGAGPLYAGYNAQLRYISPRLGVFLFQASLEDPSSLPDYQITRYPRVEGELNVEVPVGANGRFIVVGQGLAQSLAKINATQNGTVSTTAWGAMGVARFELGGLRVGGGGWTGAGIGTHTPFQQEDQGKPLAHDLPGGMDAAGNPLPGDQLLKLPRLLRQRRLRLPRDRAGRGRRRRERPGDAVRRPDAQHEPPSPEHRGPRRAHAPDLRRRAERRVHALALGLVPGRGSDHRLLRGGLRLRLVGLRRLRP